MRDRGSHPCEGMTRAEREAFRAEQTRKRAETRRAYVAANRERLLEAERQRRERCRQARAVQQ